MTPSRVPRVGVGCLIVRDDQILLAKRHGSHGKGTWSTPGGHLDFGESPAECAAREVLEETGVVVKDVKFIAITNDVFVENDRHYITIWMRAELAEGEATILASEEIAELGWFAVDALPEPLFLSFGNLVAGRGMGG